MRGEIWLGDLVIAVGQLEPEQAGELAIIRRVLGLEDSVDRPSGHPGPRPSTTGGVSEAGPADGSPDGQSPVQEEVPSAGGLTTMFGTLVELVQPAPEQQPEPSWWREEGGALVPQTSGAGPRLPEPLFRSAQSRSIVAASAATASQDGPLDVEALVWSASRLRPLAELPRSEEMTLRRGVQVLIDLGPGMSPFAADRDRLISDLEKVVGSPRVQLFSFKGSPLSIRLPTLEAEFQDWQPPPPGTPVLVISDLGVGGRAAPRRLYDDDWVQLSRRAGRVGSRIVAFVPAAPDRFPTRLSRAISLVHWTRSTTVRAVLRALTDPRGSVGRKRASGSTSPPPPGPRPPDGRKPLPAAGPRSRVSLTETQDADVVKLARLLCLATRIEPALLRKARLEFFPHRDASMEPTFWFSSLIGSRSAQAVVINGGVADLFRADLRAILQERPATDPEVRAILRARRVISDQHDRLPATLRLEEEMIWASLLPDDDGRAQIESSLRAIARALMVPGPRSSAVAHWADRVLPGLIRTDGRSALAKTVAFAVAGRVGQGSRVLHELPEQTLPLDAGWLTLPSPSSSARLAARFVFGGIEFDDSAALSGAAELPLGPGPPWLAQFEWSSGGQSGHRVMAIEPRSFLPLPAEVDEVRVRSALGGRWVVRRGPPTTDDDLLASLTIVTGLSDGILRLAYGSRQVSRLQLRSGPITAMALSPNRRTILAGTMGRVWVTEVDEWTRTVKTSRIDELRDATGRTDAVIRSVAFSPDGRIALSGGDDHSIQVWDLKEGRLLRRWEGHGTPVIGVACLPDGKTALSVGESFDLMWWDLATGRELRSFASHQLLCKSVAFSADVSVGITGCTDNTVKIWDLATSRKTASLFGHDDEVVSVALSRDGRRAISGGADHFVKIWDVATARELDGFALDDAITAVAFTPDGRQCVAAARNVVVLWDLESRRVLTRTTQPAPVLSMAVGSARVAAESRPAVAAGHANVLVAGRRESPNETEVRTAREVGRALAVAGHRIVDGGQPGVDYLAAEAFVASLEAAGQSSKGRLTHVMGPGRKPDFPLGEVISAPSWQEAFTLAVARADAVILVGGTVGTHTIYLLARDADIPVLPIGISGGAAGSALRAVQRERVPDHLNSDGLPAGEMSHSQRVVAQIRAQLKQAEPARAADLAAQYLTTRASAAPGAHEERMRRMQPIWMATEYLWSSYDEGNAIITQLWTLLHDNPRDLAAGRRARLGSPFTADRILAYITIQTTPQAADADSLVQALELENRLLREGEETRTLWQLLMAIDRVTEGQVSVEASTALLAGLEQIADRLRARAELDRGGQCKGKTTELVDRLARRVLPRGSDQDR